MMKAQWSRLLMIYLVICLSSTLEDQQAPTVMIVLLVRNKAHLLADTLALLEQQDYPKSRISLYLRSDHNEDDTLDILLAWLDKHSEHYHSKHMWIDKEPKRHEDQESPVHWTPQRFQQMMAMKEEALETARHIWADWVWFYDADTFVTHPGTLAHLVKQSNLTVVAPMLTSVGLYSNFWAGMTDTYYYQRTDQYKPILERKKVGCWAVPMVHSSLLINLNKKDSQKLSFHRKSDFYPEDDIISFALSASAHNVSLHVCNDLHYGYVMLPLDEDNHQSLADDEPNLVNLKTLMFAYGHAHAQIAPASPNFKDTLGVDQVYLINLERRPDRLANMHAIFNELGIDYQWVKAVDGKSTINEEYLKQHGIQMMADFSEPYHGRPLTYGEIGCFMSHYNIWLDVLDQGWKEVIVFEDDVRFEPFFRAKLSEVQDELQALQIEWDLIFLGRKILHNVEEAWVDKSQWLVHVNYTYWTLGYMLSARGAQKLVDEKPLAKMVPVDEYLPLMYDRHPNQTWKSHYLNRNLLAYSVHPLLLFPTHYTGEEGYISDTEDTPIISKKHDEL